MTPGSSGGLSGWFPLGGPTVQERPILAGAGPSVSFPASSHMHGDPVPEPENAMNSVERLLARGVDEDTGAGRPFSERTRRAQRSVEAYLKIGGRPRWMERVMEIDRGIAAATRELAADYQALLDEAGSNAESFAARWRAHADSRRFEQLNNLIREHNEWYPIERDLPMNPRTGEYVPVAGRPYGRPILNTAWVLDHFPEWPAKRQD